MDMSKRVMFKGQTYRLHALSPFLTKRMAPIIDTLDHIGNVSQQEVHGLTFQVYMDATTIYAARANQSNFINEIYIMESHDILAVPVPSL